MFSTSTVQGGNIIINLLVTISTVMFYEMTLTKYLFWWIWVMDIQRVKTVLTLWMVRVKASQLHSLKTSSVFCFFESYKQRKMHFIFIFSRKDSPFVTIFSFNQGTIIWCSKGRENHFCFWHNLFGIQNKEEGN